MLSNFLSSAKLLKGTQKLGTQRNAKELVIDDIFLFEQMDYKKRQPKNQF